MSKTAVQYNLERMGAGRCQYAKVCDHAACQHGVHGGSILCVHPALRRLLWIFRFHLVPHAGHTPSHT